MTEQSNFEEFTVAAYERLLACAVDHYQLVTFPESLTVREFNRPALLWRHDVDVSVHRGLRLAKLEHSMGVTSTFFFLLHSTFYNLLEKEVSRRVEEILNFGHRAGLHFDLAFYDDIAGISALEQRINDEAETFSRIFGARVEAVSFHNPEIGNALAYDQDMLAGLVNTYSGTLRQQYHYISDSNGYWRFENLFEVLKETPARPLHVLTHPEWWAEHPTSPRERISRAIDGRSIQLHHWYDSALHSMGRKNVR